METRTEAAEAGMRAAREDEREKRAGMTAEAAETARKDSKKMQL